MPGDRRQILSLLRLPIPPLQPNRKYQFSMGRGFSQPGFWFLPESEIAVSEEVELKAIRSARIPDFCYPATTLAR